MTTSVLRIITLSILLLFPLQYRLCAQVFHRDSSFGTNGIVVPNGFAAFANKNQLKKVLVQTDGKILLVGSENGQSTLEIVRLNANGSLDATYGSNGYLQLNTPTSFFANAALAPDGKVVTIFATQTQSSAYSTLYRLNTNGTTDNTFGSGGAVVLTNGTYGGYSGVVFQPDGKMVLGGSRYISSSSAVYGITRLKTNGTYDSTFGVNGKIENVYPQFASMVTNAANLALQPDGKIVMATNIPFYTPTNNAIATIRFKSNGVVDSSFALNGCNIHTIDSVDLTPAGIAVDGTSGAIVMFGASSSQYAPLPGYGYKPFILKLTPAGAPASFGTNGHMIVNMLLSDQLGVRVFPPAGSCSPMESWLSPARPTPLLPLIRVYAGSIPTASRIIPSAAPAASWILPVMCAICRSPPPYRRTGISCWAGLRSIKKHPRRRCSILPVCIASGSRTRSARASGIRPVRLARCMSTRIRQPAAAFT